MKDFLGQELKISDNVLGVNFYSTSTCFFIGQIENFTEKMVIVKIVKDQDIRKENEIIKIVPDKLVKIYNYKEN